MKFLLLVAVSTLFLNACATTQQASDRLLIHNVNGYTATDDGLLRFDALLISNGKVARVGKVAEFNALNDVSRIDGGGKTLLPGLIDAHGHVLGLGRLRMEVDLVGSSSLDEALQRIKQFADENPDLPWISGQGWNQELWPDRRFPTAADLDALEIDRPVWMERIDGHAGWANSRALKTANIDPETEAPSGGEIWRDTNGDAVGIFVDLAMELVTRHMPRMTESMRRDALDRSLQETASLGLTSVHDAGTTLKTLEILDNLADENRMPTRVYAMLGGQEVFDAYARAPQIDERDLLTVRSVKLYADGALGSRGAALIEPYSDKPDSRGLLFESDNAMRDAIRRIDAAGYQVNVHAIGDDANRQVLDAFATLGERRVRQQRHRIEHAQVIALSDLKRFAELGVIASMQPIHATSDMNMAEDRVGPDRIRGAYAWQTLLQSGVRLAAGSDYPVEPANPFFGLHAAVNRTDHNNRPAGGWYADEALTREQALYAFTLGAAWAGHQDQQLGSLEPGKWADFIFIDRDYFTIPGEEIYQIKVLETWLAGEQVYAASQ